jgi:hypothetical protein
MVALVPKLSLTTGTLCQNCFRHVTFPQQFQTWWVGFMRGILFERSNKRQLSLNYISIIEQNQSHNCEGGQTNTGFSPIIKQNQSHNCEHNRLLINQVDRTYCSDGGDNAADTTGGVTYSESSYSNLNSTASIRRLRRPGPVNGQLKHHAQEPCGGGCSSPS